MKRIICLISLLFGGNCLILAQGHEANLTKYWHYRYRLVNHFMIVGAGAGESIPAGCRNQGDGGLLDFSDAPQYLGDYLVVLSTEIELLGRNRQDPARIDSTLTELFYALNAINRLDSVAETIYPFPGPDNAGGFQASSLNGFLIKDDAPAGWLDPGSPYADILNKNLPYHGAGVDTYSGNVGAISGVYSELNRVDFDHQGASQDHLFGLLFGLAFVKYYMADAELTFNDYVLNGQKNHENFKQTAKDIADRIVRYIKVDPFTDSHWQCFQPDGIQIDPIDCPAFVSATAHFLGVTSTIQLNIGNQMTPIYARGIAEAGKFITGIDYSFGDPTTNFPFTVSDHVPVICPEGITLMDGVIVPLDPTTTSTTVQAWDLMPEFIPQLYAAEHHNESMYTLPLKLATIGNSWRDMITNFENCNQPFGLSTIQNIYDLGLRDFSNAGYDKYYGLAFRALRGLPYSAAPAIDPCEVESMLDGAPLSGPWCHSITPYANTAPGGWGTTSRFYDGDISGFRGNTGNLGNYSGIDYMMLHNLYYLTQPPSSSLSFSGIYPTELGHPPFSQNELGNIETPYNYGAAYGDLTVNNLTVLNSSNSATNQSGPYAGDLTVTGETGITITNTVIQPGGFFHAYCTGSNCTATIDEYQYNPTSFQRTKPASGKNGGNSNSQLSSHLGDLNALGIYPNPLASDAVFQINIGLAGAYTLEIYNLYGVKVKTIFVNREFEKGSYVILENISALCNGYYEYSLSGMDQKTIKTFVKIDN